jgi:hypothetical protein
MSLAIQPQDRVVFTQVRAIAQSEQAKAEIADLLDERDRTSHDLNEAAAMVAKLRSGEQMMLSRRYLQLSAKLDADLTLIDAKLAVLRGFVKP